MENILDYPDLGTYLMVTDAIKKYGPITMAELIKRLEGRAKKSHIEIIVDYMYTKKEIGVDGEGRMEFIK